MAISSGAKDKNVHDGSNVTFFYSVGEGETEKLEKRGGGGRGASRFF
jgi:hypothetical protein